MKFVRVANASLTVFSSRPNENRSVGLFLQLLFIRSIVLRSCDILLDVRRRNNFSFSFLDALNSYAPIKPIEMRYAAAYVLATLAGNNNPDVAAISKILGSVGIECDAKKAQNVIDACHGKSVDDIIAEGTKKLASLPAGGAAPSGGAAAPATAAAETKKEAAKEEPKKEEKKKEESDDEGDMVSEFLIER